MFLWFWQESSFYDFSGKLRFSVLMENCVFLVSPRKYVFVFLTKKIVFFG